MDRVYILGLIYNVFLTMMTSLNTLVAELDTPSQECPVPYSFHIMLGAITSTTPVLMHPCVT